VSHGTGSPEARIFGACAAFAALALAALLLTSCSPDMKDGLGPRVPVPNISGRAERDGASASALDVSVRDPAGNTVESAKTDANGSYALAAPLGTWEVKLKGKLPGDFDSVTRDLVIAGAGDRVALGPMDIFAYGAGLVAPSDASILALPIQATPATFRWSLPTRVFTSARAQLFDSAGAAVWYSPKSADSSATWSGTENQGSASGSPAPAGAYTWRVKFEFPDTSAARTATWRVTFQ